MSKGIKRLFYDLETSPNIGFFWRSGYKLQVPAENIIQERAIICLCYKWEGAKRVHSVEWDAGNDKPICERFTELANEADEMVAHNGDKFDLKWLNTRHLVHSLEPIPIPKTVDTLAIARKRFYLNSNRLDYIAKYLGLAGKHQTSFDWWKNIVLDNCQTSMRKMVRYCKQDVELLEKVYALLSAYHNPKTHASAISGNLDRWGCPHCGSDDVQKSKSLFSAKGIVQHQMKCKDCHRYYSIANSVYKAYREWRDSLT